MAFRHKSEDPQLIIFYIIVTNSYQYSYRKVILVAELTLHVDTLGEGLRIRSVAVVVLQALHLPGLDVDLGVRNLLQSSGGVLDLEYPTLSFHGVEAKSYVTDNSL